MSGLKISEMLADSVNIPFPVSQGAITMDITARKCEEKGQTAKLLTKKI